MPVLIAVITVSVVLSAVYVAWTAQRMDRMHVRLDSARASLETQLVRRAAAAQSFASHLEAARRLPMPVGFVVQNAAQAALESGAADRRRVETELSRALRAAVDVLPSLDNDPDGMRLLHDLEIAVRKVQFARAFYNDAARETQLLRGRRLVRAFRLAGRAETPQLFEIDDDLPVPLADGVRTT